MIRKNSLFCKIIRIKSSSKSIFESFMAQFHPEMETCPVCGSKGQCHIHAYYGRNITDFQNGKPTREILCILRVYCDSCKHSHAILPDFILPYSGYGLLFVLRVLAEFFTHHYTSEEICERYDISRKQLYKWLSLYKSNKKQWLGCIDDSETSNLSFLKYLSLHGHYSSFSQDFIQKMSFSFLQNHRNPVLKNTKNAQYCQKVFDPNYSIW